VKKIVWHAMARHVIDNHRAIYQLFVRIFTMSLDNVVSLRATHCAAKNSATCVSLKPHDLVFDVENAARHVPRGTIVLNTAYLSPFAMLNRFT